MRIPYAIIWIISVPILSLAADAPKPSAEPAEMIRTLYQGSGFKPYTDKSAWLQRATYLRQQVLIAAGLWPMPEKTPLNAVIHGRIERDDYTIEKVYFQSYPGFYVTGNFYRPKGKTGTFPAVLSPHGHWENGRLYEASAKTAQDQIKGGWETEMDAARFPLQARAANLAKLGCIVFFYDMVGYADANEQGFPHRKTYLDIDSDMHSLSIFGLQTWDSIRALDFLESLPDVDRKRLACTGASGGGTQTFVMMAIDDRLAAAAPVCMISAGDHQGGCVCENMSLLRIGTDNVELASTFAPRPFVHPTATGDWTKEFMEKGFPEIKATYKLFNAEDNFEAMRQKAGHNYNQKSREAVYNFFNKHLKLGHEGTVQEAKFTPVAPKDLSVWDVKHQRPKDAVDAAGLKQWWVESTAKQLEAMRPKDAASLEHFREVARPALEHMLATRLPAAQDIATESKPAADESSSQGATAQLIGRKGESHGVRVNSTLSNAKQRVVNIIVSPTLERGEFPAGSAAAQLKDALTQRHQDTATIEIYGTNKAAPPLAIPADVEFYSGYNQTTQAKRVHDILTAIAYLKTADTTVNLIGFGEAGRWCLLAKALAGDAIDKTIVEDDSFDYATITNRDDANYFPGVLRFGGIWPLASLCAPGDLTIFTSSPDVSPAWLDAAYTAAGAPEKLHIENKMTVEKVLEHIQQ